MDFISAQVILRLALIVLPILGFFLRRGGSYVIAPIFKPFFLAITRNSAPNVSPSLSFKIGIMSFL
jgi:hypothetical protein